MVHKDTTYLTAVKNIAPKVINRRISLSNPCYIFKIGLFLQINYIQLIKQKYKTHGPTKETQENTSPSGRYPHANRRLFPFTYHKRRTIRWNRL